MIKKITINTIREHDLECEFDYYIKSRKIKVIRGIIVTNWMNGISVFNNITNGTEFLLTKDIVEIRVKDPRIFNIISFLRNYKK